MKKLLLLLLMSFLCNFYLYAKEIKLINGDNPHYIISVTHGGRFLGKIEIELFPDVAPKHCNNFDSLVAIKFYDSTAFHRVIPGFMIQGGDPNSRNKPKSTWGYGDPSQTKVPAEFGTISHQRGIMSAARAADINSATSQFFICVAPATHLDGQYSVYGQVVSGMNIADSIVSVPRDANNNPNEKVEMMINKVDPSSVISNIEAGKSIINIYPSPATDIIKFNSDIQGLIISNIKIYDIAGVTYLENLSDLPKNLEDISIPVTSLPLGVYFIQLVDVKGEKYILRFLVNN